MVCENKREGERSKGGDEEAPCAVTTVFVVGAVKVFVVEEGVFLFPTS